MTNTLAVPAPASRSGEDHADAKLLATQITNDCGYMDERGENLCRCYLAYAALLSGDSGEDHADAKLLATQITNDCGYMDGRGENLCRCYLAYAALLSGDSAEDNADDAMRAVAWLMASEGERWYPRDLAVLINVLSASAARQQQRADATDKAFADLDRKFGEVETAYRVSAARLTEDNKRLRERLDGWIKSMPVGSQVRGEFEAFCDNPSPTAGPAEGRTSPVTQDEMDDCYKRGGKATADGPAEGHKHKWKAAYVCECGVQTFQSDDR